MLSPFISISHSVSRKRTDTTLKLIQKTQPAILHRQVKLKARVFASCRRISGFCIGLVYRVVPVSGYCIEIPAIKTLSSARRRRRRRSRCAYVVVWVDYVNIRCCSHGNNGDGQSLSYAGDNDWGIYIAEVL